MAGRAIVEFAEHLIPRFPVEARRLNVPGLDLGTDAATLPRGLTNQMGTETDRASILRHIEEFDRQPTPAGLSPHAAKRRIALPFANENGQMLPVPQGDLPSVELASPVRNRIEAVRIGRAGDGEQRRHRVDPAERNRRS